MRNWLFIALGIITIPAGGFGLIFIAYGIFQMMKDKKINEWLESKSNCQYKHAYNDTGIAVDTVTETIYLKNKAEEQSYPFSDIREWKYNISSGGEVIGGPATLTAAHNIRIANQNKKNTGFFVTVKDINNPQWRIAFPSKNLEKELLKWMEIFRQHINNE